MKSIENKSFHKVFLSISYFFSVILLTLLFVRLFINSDLLVSWELAFIFSPYVGAIIMAYIAQRKGANWKWIILFFTLGLTTTKTYGLISIISFYYLLGKQFEKK